MRNLVVVSMLGALAGCVSSRTSAATAPTVGPFDPSKSDPHALEVADAEMAAVGGYPAWEQLQELNFDVQYQIGGKRQGWFQHHWDRWNGRHHFLAADGNSLAKGDAHVHWLDVKYYVFDDNHLPYVTYQDVQFDDLGARQYADLAHQRLDEDIALFALFHRLRDPGVHLADGGEITGVASADDLCKPSCTTLEVTFDKGAGDGKWVIEVNSQSHRPELIAKQIPAGRVAYRIDGWTKAGGLEWPTRLTNVEIKDEVFDYSSISVGAPQEAQYAVPVQRPDSAPTERHTGKFDQSTFNAGHPAYKTQ